MKRNEIKARRDYYLDGSPALGGFAAVEPERVRVTGFQEVNPGEEWCRIRFDGDTVSTMVAHPERLSPIHDNN